MSGGWNKEQAVNRSLCSECSGHPGDRSSDNEPNGSCHRRSPKKLKVHRPFRVQAAAGTPAPWSKVFPDLSSAIPPTLGEGCNCAKHRVRGPTNYWPASDGFSLVFMLGGFGRGFGVRALEAVRSLAGA